MIMRRCGLILLPALGLAACTVRGAQEGASQNPPPAASTLAPYRYAPPPELDDGWRVAHAEELRIDVVQLEAMTEAIRRQEYANVHAVLIEKDGRLVYEEYFGGVDRRWRGDQRETVRTVFQRDSLHDTRSVGKSITSALIGVALGAGAIASLDTPLVAFFPEHARLVTPEKRRISLRHALTMSAGLDWNEGAVPYTSPTNDSEQMYASNDPAGFVFGRALAAEPGSVHNYNSGLPVLLGFVVSRVTGRSFGAYAREVLFDPLGIRQVEWGGPTAWADIPEMRWNGSEPWARVASPAGGLWIRPRDLAKFGHLYLNAGRWNGRQLIPAPWVVESTRRHIAAKDSVSEFGEHGYGYFWWYDRFHTPYGELEVHTAHGNGGQRIFVIPSLDMAVTVLAGRYNDPEANWLPEQLLLRHIVPAARGSERSEPAALVFAHATVVDVSDGSLLPDRTVVVEGNRIRAVGSSEAVAIPQDAQVLDARGKYLIPGLWDMHTHLLWSTDASEHSAVKMPRDLDSWTLWERYYAPSFDLLIAHGVTGIREMHGNLEVARRVQAEAEAGVRLAPRIIVAGHIVDGSPPLHPSLVAATPERGRALVDSLAAAGADFIKPYSHLAPEVYFAIVERAHERGIPVAGHVPFRVPASAAAVAGQRSFEHLIGVVPGCSSEEARLIDLSREQIVAAAREDRDRVVELDRQWKVRALATQDHGNCRRLLETLARNRTWQVPTLVLNRGLAYLDDPDFAADPRLKYIPPAWRDSWLPENDPYLLSTEQGYQLRRQHHARKMEITGLAAQVGVGIMAGSDTPSAFVFPGFALHDELALLVEAGLTPLQALQTATLNPARYLESTDSVGTVDAGKLADLVLLDANPLEDIRNTRRIRAVVVNGRYLDRQALDGLLAGAERAANATAQERPAVAMIGTGTLGGMLGPVIAGLGYPLIYGSREPERETVRALVARSGANASAALPLEAATQAEIIILAVPPAVLEEVARGLGDLTGKIVIDVSGGLKRVAADGYLELVSDSTNAERLQSRHPTARVVRILLPTIVYFVEPLLVGTPPTVPIAGNDPRAREAVARMMFDIGLDPWDAGPLRFSRVFDAMSLMGLVPLQQGHTVGYELKFLPSVPLSCFVDVAELFGFGRPYDLDDVARFPRRQPPIPCSEWRRRLDGVLQR